MSNVPPDYNRLGPPAGQSILIVGGCGGIGRALVLAAVDIGLDVMVMDLAASISATDLPDGVPAIDIDLRNEASICDAFEFVDKAQKTLHHVVFASGYTADLVPVKKLVAEGLDDIMNGNLRGQVFAARESLGRMKRGSLVFVSTGIAQVGASGYVAYGMAKAGINALTRILAAESAPEIRVNGIAPGATDTSFIRGGLGRGVTDLNVGAGEGATRFDMQDYESKVPLVRIGVPEDMAGPILFLMSDAARYVTGQVLHVNGGVFMRD